MFLFCFIKGNKISMCAEKPRPPPQPSCEDPARDGLVVFYGEEALTEGEFRVELFAYLLFRYKLGLEVSNQVFVR